MALDVSLINNGGYSFDLSGPVVDRAILHSENSYYIPNMRVRGRIARTHLPSNTAFRGFGGPQVYTFCFRFFFNTLICLHDWFD